MNLVTYNMQIKNQLFQKISSLYNVNKSAWIIICLGIILRFVQYLFNRSLWYDESLIALNIVDRTFLELLQPLDYGQAAPIGFLMTEKLLGQLFSYSEYILRLLPFLAGISSLFLFYLVAKRCLRPKALLIALGLFALSEPLIFYSSELKQYSSDVAVTLLVYLTTLYVHSSRLTTSRAILAGIVGAIAIWFSHAALFVLAGVGSVLFISYLRKGAWVKVVQLSSIFLIGLLSFVTYYFVSLRALSSSKFFQTAWKYNFVKPSNVSSSRLESLAKLFIGVKEPFNNLAGSSSGSTTILFVFGGCIFIILFFIGCVSFLKRKKEIFFILVSPIFFTLLASGLQKYPLSSRLLLFMVPSLLILIAEGTVQVIKRTRFNQTVISTCLVGLLFSYSLLDASYHLIKPRLLGEIKPVLSYIGEHHQTGDLLYLYYASCPPFKYYSDQHGFLNNTYGEKGKDVPLLLAKKNDQQAIPNFISSAPQLIVGVSSTDNWENYKKDLGQLRGHERVWILFSQFDSEEAEFFLDYLNKAGIRLDSFKSYGSEVYLYDLSRDAQSISRQLAN